MTNPTDSQGAEGVTHQSSERYVSKCHGAEMRVVGDSFGEGTNHYECLECHEPCDIAVVAPKASDRHDHSKCGDCYRTHLPEAHPVTPQASDELEALIEQRVNIASTQTKSSDPFVQLAWLADGKDLWYRSNGKLGHSPAKARRYIISSATRLVEEAREQAKQEVLDRLLEKGHGGGNWRRIIELERSQIEEISDFITSHRSDTSEKEEE